MTRSYTQAHKATTSDSERQDGDDNTGIHDDDDGELFEYESDLESDEAGMMSEDGQDEAGAQEEVLSDEEQDEGTPQAPPEVPDVARKGKSTSRRQFATDLSAISLRFATDSLVQGLQRDDAEDVVRFTLRLSSGNLKISLMFPELSGYPSSHDVMCFSENESLEPRIESVLSEVSRLPVRGDGSLNGIIDYLVHRLVQNEPCPFADKQPEEENTDEEFEYDDDHLLAIDHVGNGLSDQVKAALKRDFCEIVSEGYRPGFTRLSELDLVVSVSKKGSFAVSTLGVPMRALEAWDPKLVTGKVVYLVLLINFGSQYPVDIDNLSRGQINFKVGICSQYKPSRKAIATAFRSHVANPYTDDFEAISISGPLSTLFCDKFTEILHTRRRNVNIGWAAAENHCLSPDKALTPLDEKDAREADKAEKSIADSSKLPRDPMESSVCNNYPLLAFAYLVRRFILCPRFCLICYKRCDQVIISLKPFVCESQLCLFQLINLGLGPSLEHEICSNTAAIDLLVQLAYVAAKEGSWKGDLLPQGLSLQVPRRGGSIWKYGDPVVDFDANPFPDGLAALIDTLPPIEQMKSWLLGDDLSAEEKFTNRNRKLSDMHRDSVSPSAWSLLRFIVVSNTSYLKLIEDEDEMIQGLPKEYRQFRFVAGSPAKEHLLAENVKSAQARNPRAMTYPTLFAWHGSSVKNFHCILREGLHFKTTVNGRAYGHGCYFALQGEVSFGTYAVPNMTIWKNAEFPIDKLAALAEIVNVPQEFVSNKPYLVVDKVDWIQCRYLIVQRSRPPAESTDAVVTTDASDTAHELPTSQLPQTLPLDPNFRITLNNKVINIPDVVYKLERLASKVDNADNELNASDSELLNFEVGSTSTDSGNSRKSFKRYGSSSLSSSSPSRKVSKKEPELFVPCDDTRLGFVKLLPPPPNPSRTAMITIGKELRAMLEQQKQEGPVQAGFYFDPERSNDNMFTWVLEVPVGSFDQDLPIVKDMKMHKITSLLFEIRFGESFPFSPPFFRVVHPRFLPFTQGGGGHVTGGGSICMDLLTSDGWLSSYSISAVLLQIRMAISNLDPRPARLASNWNEPYSIEEAVVGFKRAAATHGWKVPQELETIVRMV
ncbi:uncharacterized protein JCM15063_005038 [Sporobolomyces koalae]|uniref:uncharacterized protein n=1 Tax=Sporobolomyces koalae TaxID=500713 RepID=UPI00317BC0BD